ncbi:MAG: 50S ribosomal protein L25 [Planctomycetes bacterium]|nr:50S ribosomal protein L25 [Planctomycetota bacterium]
MEIISIKATKREKVGTRAAMRERSEGRVPAVIYGHGKTPEHVTIDAHQFGQAIKHHARVFRIDDGVRESFPALLKQLQWDALGEYPMHADFTRLEAGEKVRVGVPIHYVGHAKGLAAGGRLNTPIQELQIECDPAAIPDHIEVVVTSLEIGQAIHIAELAMPAGVRAIGDATIVVCNVSHQTAQVTEPAAGEAGAQPEPEKKSES